MYKDKNETKEKKTLYSKNFYLLNLYYMQTIVLLKGTDWKSNIQF